jgi:hypothetical protein
MVIKKEFLQGQEQNHIAQEVQADHHQKLGSKDQLILLACGHPKE